MALFNYATKEITLKIVYYGPGLSGKTTNIQYLHSALNADSKGKLLSLSTESDRTLFFDFLPVELGKIKEFSVRFQLYTVPGQVRYNATRKVVLKGADAVVFVADSQRDMKEQNIESIENMRENLTSNNINPDEIPVVLQYNKRDLTNILTIDELNSDLNINNVFNIIEAEAINGKGVEDTFRLITRLLLKDIARKHKIEIQPAALKEEEISEVQKTDMEPVQLTSKPEMAALREEEIGEVQKTDMEPVQLTSEPEMVEPAGYALEEELEEVSVPEYQLEEEMEAITTAGTIEPQKEFQLITEYPVKEPYQHEPIDIWESRETPSFSMEATPAVEEIAPEKKPDMNIEYPAGKELYPHKTIDIWEAKGTPEISMEEMPLVDNIELKKEPDLKKYAIERDVYLQEALGISEAKEAPAVSDDSLKMISADIAKLNAVLSDLQGTVASLKADIHGIRESLRKAEEKAAEEEDKNIKEMRKEQREMRGILRDIAAAISDIKVKKSWFRF